MLKAQAAPQQNKRTATKPSTGGHRLAPLSPQPSLLRPANDRVNASSYSRPLKNSRVCENGTLQADGIWVKVYRRALADALQPVARTGARMQPLNESSHHCGDEDRTRQMVCGASAALGPNRDAGEKHQSYHRHVEVRGSGSTSVQKTELGRRP